MRTLLQHQNQSGRLVAAICNAPRILARLGILSGRQATSYPTAKPDMQNVQYMEDHVVVSKNSITSRGPGTAMQFAYEILRQLGLLEQASALESGMLFNSMGISMTSSHS